MNRLSFSLVLCCTTLLSLSASAYSEGQTGYTGAPGRGSCLECHGVKQYPGLQVRLEAQSTTSCWVDRNGTLEEMKLPTLSFGETVAAVVEIPTPAAADAPVCPTNSCCGESAPGENDAELACIGRGQDLAIPGCGPDNYEACCAPGLDICDEPVAGFNAETVGGGAFTAGEGSRLLTQGGEELPNEITHSSPRRFADGAVLWSFSYTAPQMADAAANGVTIYTGANVANGNGREDPLDLNSNHQLDVVLTDGANMVHAPAYCAVCSDGKLSVDGSCCSCVSAKPSAGTYTCVGAMSLLGFLLLGRRRRRR